MTAEEQIKKITELLNDLALCDIDYEEYEAGFMEQSVNDIKDEMWEQYRVICDICDILNA